MNHLSAILKTLIFICIGMVISMTVNAAGLRVVYPNQCAALKGSDDPFLLILKKGDNIHKAILNCVNSAEINVASIAGLGAIQDPILAYYDLSQKKYLKKQFSGIFELLALSGNVSLLDDKRMLHLHTVIGDRDYVTYGGHLVGGTIGVTAEITIIPMKGTASRQYNEEVGLPLITPGA